MKNLIYIILSSTLFLSISCKDGTKTVEIHSEQPKTDLKEKKLIENPSLISFLENPIDLQNYKTKKGKSLSSVSRAGDYHHHPNIKDSIFYEYSAFPNDSLWSELAPVRFIVFKYADKKHSWDDDTEILIEFIVFGEDKDLKKADLVGLTKTELETKFGKEYKVIDDRMVYSNRNRIIIIEFDSLKVKSYRFLKLSTETIDSTLVRQIIR